MQLLIDTDIFCKLALGEILDDTIGLFGVDASGCGRLPALPHMLRRGKLQKAFGDQISDELILRAESFQAIGQPGAVWLDRLTPVQSIDPGEAQLFALAAENGLIVMTGDKRALRALKDIPELTAALEGRVVVMEAVLLKLCDQIGTAEVSRRVRRLVSHDTMVQVCFSPINSDPQGALLSYHRSVESELAPLVLWSPQMGAQK